MLVQNWQFGQLPEDDVELATLVLPATDSGNLAVSGPTSVAAGTPFNVTLAWNVPTMNVGDTWVAYVELGSDSRSIGDVGTLLLTVKRTG